MGINFGHIKMKVGGITNWVFFFFFSKPESHSFIFLLLTSLQVKEGFIPWSKKKKRKSRKKKKIRVYCRIYDNIDPDSVKPTGGR